MGRSRATSAHYRGQGQKFFCKLLVCKYGLPHTIITDNDQQFNNQAFRDFCIELHIRHRFTSVDHPKSNGEAKVTNWIILQGLPTKLDESKGPWADKLPRILWAYYTTPWISTNKTPFNLSFCTEAVIPVEIRLPTMQTKCFDKATNLDRLRTNLDQETRDRANLKMVAYRQKVARYYNSQVKSKIFPTRERLAACQSIETHRKRQVIFQLGRTLLSNQGTSARSLLARRLGWDDHTRT